MACLEALGLPITPRRKTPPTVLLLLWALWCRDLRLPQCLWSGEKIWTYEQRNTDSSVYLEALPEALLYVHSGVLNILHRQSIQLQRSYGFSRKLTELDEYAT